MMKREKQEAKLRSEETARMKALRDSIAAAREAFAAGDAEGALDLALAAVRDSDDADAKEDARALVLTFIDALGAVPAATKARRKLAMYLF